MRFPFGNSTTTERPVRVPQPSVRPKLRTGSLAASYATERLCGDFFDLLEVGQPPLIVLVLMDIAGRRNEALSVAAAVQERYRARAPEIFARQPLNQADAVTELLIEINRGLLETSEGVRCTPTFLACYEEGLGTLTYINAGHEPGLLRDSHGVTLLEANGPPLGLFSHATYDAQHSVLEPASAILLVSKGLLEVRSGGKEFGVERLREAFQARPFGDAAELCAMILEGARVFKRATVSHDDMTVVALVRAPQAYFVAAQPLF